jgi:EAL domain-containing protein (putative c-di-GMP-specific phosphodiesterase class I)
MNLAASKASGTIDGAALLRLRRRIDQLVPESPAFRLLGGRRLSGKFYGATITSAWQGLRDPASGRVVAHEALARSYSSSDAGLSPWRLFAGAASDEHLVALDRLCRTIHALNFRVSGLDDAGGILVLNVHERLLRAVPKRHGSFFGELLTLIGLPPQRIVIDLPPLPSFDVHWLKGVVEAYQRAGFGVAFEASSAVQAKLVATLVRPEWIRLAPDRISSDTVAALHGLGVKLIATRVETASADAHCRSVGADLVQGLHYGPVGETL